MNFIIAFLLGFIFNYHFQQDFNRSFNIRLEYADSIAKAGKTEKSIQLYLELLKEVDSLKGNKENSAILLDRIGSFYDTNGLSFKQSKDYYSLGLERRKSVNSLKLWKSYYNLAKVSLREKKYDSARLLINSVDIESESTLISKSEKAGFYFLYGIIEIGILKNSWTDLGLQRATSSLNNSSEIYKSIGDSLFWGSASMELADLYILNDQPEKAIITLNRIRPIKKIQNSLRYNRLLSKGYRAMNYTDSVYKYFEIESDILRKMIYDQNLTGVAKITEDYRTDKQLDQAEETAFLASQRAKTYGIAVLILLLILAVSYLIFLQTIQRKKLENLQAVVLGEEQERKRLAKDLHDGIGVLLTSIRMRLSSFEEKVEDQKAYHDSLEQIDNACTEVRRVSHNLSPASLEKLGLEEALLDLVDQVKLTGDLEVEEEVSIEQGLMKTEDEVLVYRIVQELINNTLKYAEASQIRFSLRKQAKDLRLSFHDNGKGFDQQKVKPGIGLKSIASRLDILKGKMQFNSHVGRGTQFEITIPVNV